MNIGVVGSRDWPDRNFVNERLRAYVTKNDVVVTGGGRGVDTYAEYWAYAHDVPVIVYRPDWERYGRSAGFRRNHDIVRNADMVIAFSYNNSRGTAHSIELARHQGKSVLLFTERDLEV